MFAVARALESSMPTATKARLWVSRVLWGLAAFLAIPAFAFFSSAIYGWLTYEDRLTLPADMARDLFSLFAGSAIVIFMCVLIVIATSVSPRR